MPKSRITEFARASRGVKRVQQPYGGYHRQAEAPLDAAERDTLQEAEAALR